jgi:hypothetical protein
MTKTTRATETRAATQKDYVYTPPSEMEIPDELRSRFTEEGYTLKWIRFLIDGSEDYKNIGRRQREGWEWVLADEISGYLPMSREFSTQSHKNLVTVGDLALAKCPTYKVNARRSYFAERAQEAVKAARLEARQSNDRRMDKYTPVFDESSARVQVRTFAPNSDKD